MKCLVVDDESIAIKGIINYIGKLDFLEVVDTCSSALEAADILKTTEIDLMFLVYFKEKVLTIHQTMTSLEEMLPKESFFRIHRSFLVNTSCIDSISGGRLFINGKELPVSKQRRDELLDTVVYKNLISK